ncbi:MAG TPA: phosphoglycerate kinase, partial [Gemmatimonadales bacterium]|nr:phosphoglycerate kinase [Gemmatimonadales bacterium]
MLPSISDLEVEGRPVLVRADLNVPLSGGTVADDYRIRASLPTIAELRERGAVTVVCSHLGRPKGVDPAFSLGPVAVSLGSLGGFAVTMAADVAGASAREAVSSARPGDVVMLENTRFEEGETANAAELADRLAGLADCFVLDAFGSAHRAHASTVGVAARLRSAAGRLLAAEVAGLSRLLADPDRPYVVVLGGAKVSDKLGVMRSLLPKVDAMLVGGAMCFTLLAAEGYAVGGSRVESDMIEEVADVLGSENGSKVALPTDIVAAEDFAVDSPHRLVDARDIPDDMVGLDIGPATVERFSAVIGGADTLFWNGPMGVWEWPPFSAGTRAIAEAVAACPGYTVAGGGEQPSGG